MENMVTLKGIRIVRNSGVYSISIPISFVKNGIVDVTKEHDVSIKQTRGKNQ